MKKIVSFVLITALVFSFAGCGNSSKIKLGKIDAEFNIQTKEQEGYMNDDLNNWQLYTTFSDNSSPNALKITWEWTDTEKPEQFVVKISETKDFKDSLISRTKRNSVNIYNLKSGTKYYGCVVAETDHQETDKSEIFEVTTKPVIGRFINCDGVKNMRDMGTWKTEDGKTLKQGMMYRCGKLNSDGSKEKLITDDGLYTMKHLGIKTEIDLRGASSAVIDKSFIENASYYRIPIIGSADAAVSNMFDRNRNELKNIFEIVSKEENFPLIIHCAGGADRTGFVAYTLNGLLGVSKDDLLRDYLLTNFALTSSTRILDYINPDYVSGYDSVEGDTLSQKIENYLLSIDIPKEQIDSFKSIMKE